MITRIEAHNYRCFPRLSVGMDRYHVLAGANGAGKTTLLDIPVLVGDMIRQQRFLAAFLGRSETGKAARASTLPICCTKVQARRSGSPSKPGSLRMSLSPS